MSDKDDTKTELTEGDEETKLIEKLRKQAMQIGLVEDKITVYIQQGLDREERAKERKEKEKEQKLLMEQKEQQQKLLMEQKEQEQKLLIEQKKLEMQMEEQKINLEKERMAMEDRQKQREADLEKERLRAQVETAGNVELPSFSQTRARAPFPKLPMFKERDDDIDSFIFRFESHAKLCNWNQNSWPIYFASCLQGAPLTFYHSLCASGEISYDEMKEHFLKKFQCTEEGFQRKISYSQTRER